VVHRARLAWAEDPETDPELWEARGLTFELGVEAELRLEPLRIANIEDEPALAGRPGSGLRALQWGLTHFDQVMLIERSNSCHPFLWNAVAIGVLSRSVAARM